MTTTDPGLPAAVRAAGGFGMAGVLAGLLVLLGGCFGLDAALSLSPVPVVLGAAGLVAAVVGLASKRAAADPLVLAVAFTSILAVAGGLLEMAAWRHWPILFDQVR